MPRIYAPNEEHNMTWGAVDFLNGVSAVAVGTNVAWFTASGYTIDNSKHETTLLDDLMSAQLRAICAYLGITIDQGEEPDSKYTLVRAIEGSISAKYITGLTVTSTAGAAVGTSDIAIADAGEYAYKFKTGKTAAPALLYMDIPDETWATLESGDDIEPGGADHDKVTVVRLNAEGAVIGIGNDDLTLNAG